jgi:hypothetical protein
MAGPMDECEVCQGQHGQPIATMTFTSDDTAEPCPVRACRDCLAALFRVMVDRWHESIEQADASVAWLMEGLGISPGVYVCPNHVCTGGYESCCECGGWEPGAIDDGQRCTEATIPKETQ